MSETVINVPGRFNPIEYGTPLANASDIYDENNEKSVQEILDDENDKIALQDTKIGILNTAGTLVETSDGSLSVHYKIGDIFYNIQYSKGNEIKHYYVAKVDGFAGDNINDTNKFTDAGTSSVNALNIKTSIIKNALQGDDAYGVYVKQWKEDNPNLEPTTENGFLKQTEWLESLVGDSAYEVAVKNGYSGSESQWLEYIRGKSAREIYNSVHGTTYDDAHFIEAIKANYPMKYVEYDEDNYSATGITTISSITASEATEGKLWFMPNSDNTETKLFISVNDGTAEIPDYKWYNMGVVDVPSNVLTEEMVDNECVDGATDEPASAKAVMQLKAKLEGVTASDEKVSLISSDEGQNVYDGYINGSTGEYTQSNYNKFIVVPLNGAKSVRWLGKENAANSSLIGWAFGTFSGEIDATLSTFTALSKGVYANNPLDNQAVEYVKDAPEGATHAVITIWIYKSGGGSAVTMDNFYCYLQSGETVLNIVDLKIDSVNNEIKIIESNLSTSNSIDLSQYKKKPGAISRPNDTTWTIYSPPYENTGGIFIPVENGQKYIITAPNGYPSKIAFLTNNNNPVNGEDIPFVSGTKRIDIDNGQSLSVLIPQTCNYLFVHIGGASNWNKPQDISLVSWKNIPEVVDSLDDESTTNALSANQGKVLNEHISEIDSRFISEERVDLAGQRKVLYYAAASTGLWTAGNNPVAHIALPVNPGDIFNVIANNIYSTTYAFFTDDYDEIYSGEAAPVLGEAAPVVNGTEIHVLPKNNETRITVPDGTKYLYILYGNIKGNGSYIPKSITAITIKAIQEQVAISNDSFAGYISDTGEFISSKNYLTTKPYSGSFNIRLMKGYKIVRVVLYDANNNVVNYNFVGSVPGRVMFSAFSYDNENYASLKKNDCRRTEFGLMYMPEGFYVRIVIAKEDGSVINIGETVIKSFYDLNCGSYKNELDLQQDGIKAAVRRAINITSLYYYCLGKFPVKDSKYKDLFDANTVCCGVPYSLPREKNGLVGYGCNIKNFITAIQNHRSVMYTENIKNGTSEYGIQYTNYSSITSNSATYFGAVCSSLVNYIYGIRLSYQCQSMGVHTDEYEYLDREENYNIYNMPPLTAIQTPLHVFVILDFLTDKYGNRKFAIVAEETTPTTTLYVYSVETLQFRLDYLDRYYELNNPTQGVRYLIPKDGLLESTKNNFEGSLYSFDTNDYRRSIPEIMTFAGDYASFPIGQSPIFINAIPSNKYDQIDLYFKSPTDSEYSLLQTLDISNYIPDENGIIDINITQYVDYGGLYRARLSNSSDSLLLSDYTYFEAVKLSASVNNVTSSRKEINITGYEGATLFGKLFVSYWIPASDTGSSEFSNAKDGFGYISQDEIDNNKIIINTSGLTYNLANSKVCVIMQGEYNQVQFSYDIPSLNS